MKKKSKKIKESSFEEERDKELGIKEGGKKDIGMDVAECVKRMRLTGLSKKEAKLRCIGMD